MIRRCISGLLVATVAIAGLTACGSGDRDELVIGATPVPHAEILNFVAKELAPRADLKVKVIEFTDYVQPNAALGRGIDANYFQHRPYLDEYSARNGAKLVSVASVHVEPLGVYSKKLRSLADVPIGAEVVIPQDATNGGRALQLLAAHNLISIKEGASTERGITDNPKRLKIKALEAAQLPRSLEDVALAVINGNFALAAGLNPASDALALEDAKDNPYANLLVTKQGNEHDPRMEKLAALLRSDEVKAFIERRYVGVVLPAV
ncbi:MAG: MetQ/NlpA family ABC transporter substrate-binding protein [Longispora sp.]|nr:MetQ/NlpA family ABC transporter substrate-binding protein [Longispora sp. (in: high G+C Gram-positive bacteria)]